MLDLAVMRFGLSISFKIANENYSYWVEAIKIILKESSSFNIVSDHSIIFT